MTVPHQARLKGQFKGMLKASYTAGRDDARALLHAKFSIDPGSALDDYIAWILAQADLLTSIETAEILRLSKPVLIEAIRSGKGVRETIAILDGVLKGYDLNLGAARLETIVRTNTLAAFNQARLEQFAAVSDEIQAYQYSAIWDDRTSEICQALDTKIISKAEVDKYNPPNHFNCRSVLIPIFDDEEKVQPSQLPATVSSGGGFLELAT
jgi:SPP1 gp7 family putative phage head morphogenesis protein